MIVFTEGCDLDLNRKEAAASEVFRDGPAGRAGKKRKEATAEKKMKEAAVLESGDGALKKEGDSLFKEGEMLKLREEYWEAALLWEDKLVPALLWKITQVPTVDKKKKKVVKIIMPNAYIDDIIENPDMMRELSDEEMAECLEEYRQSYAIAKVMNAKNHAYQQALIAQYRAFGFAYDEKEVIDEEEEEEVVLKN
ncbi:unnamed protein product [Miscanthus lutarioriparius]|uniref:Uncharacterized protein n=1 Tax=Miscanthus lutarioriparius TaxID=422564 RepID=A0A811PLB4_9POAL|nr:unnamed protein product [Miscanthus lutarioriparius]